MKKLKEILLSEMALEAETTRKMFKVVPQDKYGWKPHAKSMVMQTLATHIAECFGMVKTVLTSTELDFNNAPYQPHLVKNNAELMEWLEKNIADCKESLLIADEAAFWEVWTMKSGEVVYMACAKYDAIRHMFCQITHHRAQLGLYLRLLEVPIPGSYGPSADEM